jgi:vitamin B12 transporter
VTPKPGNLPEPIATTDDGAGSSEINRALVGDRSHTMKRVSASLLLLVCAGATGSLAETEHATQQNPRQLDDSIVVIANRHATPASRVGSAVTTLSRDDFTLTQTGQTIDLLATLPSVDVVSSGGFGGATSIYMRGANSHHTLVFVDGVKQNDPGNLNGAFDFAHLNSADIDRIEILRGSQSVLYGSDAIGGVIDIRTRRGYGKPSVELQAEVGSYSTYRESLRFSGGTRRVSYSLFGSRVDSDGFSSSREAIGPTETDGYENSELSGHLSYAVDNGVQVDLGGRYIEGVTDIDQTDGVLDDTNYRNWTTTRNFAVSVSRKKSISFWQPSLQIDYARSKLVSHDYEDDEHVDQWSYLRSDGERISLESRNLFALSADNDLTVGGRAEWEEFKNDLESIHPIWGASADVIPTNENRLSGAYVLDEHTVAGRLFVTLGLRFDDHQVFGGHSTVRATGAYLVPGTTVKLRGSYSTGYKSPSLYQLFHELWGNRDLKPEESETIEFGFDLDLLSDALTASVTLYQTDFTELISLDAMTWKPNNIESAASDGYEVSISGEFAETQVRANYSFADIRNETEGDSAPILRRPKHKASLSINRAITDRFAAALKLRVVGTRYDTDFRTYTTVEMSPFATVGLAGSYELFDDLSVRLRIENLLDQKYEEIITYATSGRAVYIGLTGSL